MYSTVVLKVEVKKACIQNDTKVCAVARVYSIILETLTCTLLPNHQYWQVTHVGREAIQKALNILRKTEYVSFVSVVAQFQPLVQFFQTSAIFLELV